MMKWVAMAVAMAVMQALCSSADLQVGFYDTTCPSAEALVQQAVASAFADNPGIAAGIIRTHFHDCFVRGCDASVLLDSTPDSQSEKEAIPNLTLRGLEVIDAAKEAIEAACPGVVSCADILTFASRDSAALAGNISYQVPAGRRDGFVSNVSEVDLPRPFDNATELIRRFADKNLTADEMVTLSGAHSIGVSHCGAFSNRISPNLLEVKCTPTAPNTTTVRMDLITADVLDNKYYVGVQNNLGLFTSDHALTTVDALKAAKFARATVKMGEIEVLTGEQGEIRQQCRVINSAPSLAAE
ncbi:unnamed protein product [Spirodela intermedia]|uniref:Peroxidase n=1 Tax=Spirodela intermedia TaxID=51605 RepID=A0A7I8I921_SPIIN|nr:unnamed protein product [Spirodela intermedia]CAA6653933.1 unnamed protein product [Spirodela intermedia]